VEVSADTFPEGADTVIIATGLNFPDALAGASLAGAYGAPILLVNSTLPAVVEDEIDRLGATDCIILGSEAAVSADVEDDLAALGLDITRIGGADRFETAAMIAGETVALLGDAWDGSAFLVTGYDFPDALSAGPLSSYAGYPVFLGSQNGVSDATLATMNELGVTQVYIIGGPSVITLDADAGVSAQVLAGDDRYETAAAVAEFGLDLGLDYGELSIATGAKFPDALTAGAAQGITGGSLLITPPTYLHPAIADAISYHAGQIADVEFIGSTAALSQDVRDEVWEILNPVP
jgi:putative cell wall-binding protein